MSRLGKLDEAQYFSVSDYKPIITYAGDIELFKNLEATLSQALPQEATEWRRSFARDLKSVKLSAVFEPFSENLFQNENHYHFLKQPILHVFWLQCADVETYKTALHEDIKKWLHILEYHSISDWLIVLVEAYDFRKHNKILPRTTVLDKIKNDFKHVDRCLSVINPLKSEFRTGSSWRALVVNMRLLILSAYDKALLRFGEYVRMQRESRNQPGWSFCNYFLLQEELAFALEMLGVHEEALIQYDELEALFTQFIRNSSLTDAPEWLSSFQIPVDSWSSILLTCKVNQNYREAIRDRCISLLDFRCYLFCRQAAMLLFTSKPWEIAQRTLPFIHNCLNEIRILEIHYPDGAIACWMFLCCLEVMCMCQNFNETAQVDACSLFTAPLMELAMMKLNELGELCGLMPDCEQTSEQLHTVVSLSAGIGDSIRFLQTNTISPVTKLKEALTSKETYSKYYLELSEQAMITYKHIGRLRSAKYIGKLLADFYMRTGELLKASGLLVSALSAYEEDSWPVLANQIRLQLLRCYKEMNETEKFLKTCISVACSSHFELPQRISYFNDAMDLLRTQKDLDCTVPVDECFAFDSIILEVLSSGLIAQATLVVTNKFPCDVTCPDVLISVTSCSNNDVQKTKKFVAADIEKIYMKQFKNSAKNHVPSEIPLVYVLEYQQDKSLANTKVECKNPDSFLRRQDSQKLKKPPLLCKGDFSKALSSGPVTLKPGDNTIILLSKTEESNGTYCLGQFSINIFERLHFLSSSNFFSKMKYTIKHVAPQMSIDIASDRALLVGIQSTIKLQIDMGTVTLNKDVILKLRASDGLKIGLPNDQQLQEKIEVNLPCTSDSDHNNYSISLVICSEFPTHFDEHFVEYKIYVQCPWSNSEIPLLVQFLVPFTILYRVHTAKSRKFVLITMTGCCEESLALNNPNLSSDASRELTLKSLNPPAEHSIIIKNKLKAKFVWELISEIGVFDKYTLRFTINYEVADKSSTFECEFNISNFMTLYSIESTVDPMRGCEICRVNTMCHLVFTVKRVAPTNDHSLKYEVLTDQTMWAVCNMSTGVIILDESDKCSKTVEIMPLVQGYLPLPTIKLSKYFPAESNVGEKRLSPRLEPFYHGQVFNANKATQVQVLPSSGLSDS